MLAPNRILPRRYQLHTGMLHSNYVFLLCLHIASALASSSPIWSTAGLTIELGKRSSSTGSVNGAEDLAWLKNVREGLATKYGGARYSSNTAAQRKRASATNELVNQHMDFAYYGSIGVGTPPTLYNVVLDTGSTDLWLSAADCFSGCNPAFSFNPATSSTFRNLSAPFSVQYGLGSVAGYYVSDTVQMSGLVVNKQTFALCNRVSVDNKDPSSGLMGLGFAKISANGVTPFWENLASQNAWSAPLMAFWLTRFKDVKGAKKQQIGGAFNMGFTNQSLYTGEIEYIGLVGQGPRWWIPMIQISVNNTAISLHGANAVIDTGTTVIIGPTKDIAAIFAQIPGSIPASNEFTGFYQYPCSTKIQISLTFSHGNTGRGWPIDPRDFELTRMKDGTCIAALLGMDFLSPSLQWIIGDTFLKNVYSVFRFSPPAVGFASLSHLALSLSSVDTPLPTPSIPAPLATVDAKAPGNLNSTLRTKSNANAGPIRHMGTLCAVACGVSLFLATISWM